MKIVNPKPLVVDLAPVVGRAISAEEFRRRRIYTMWRDRQMEYIGEAMTRGDLRAAVLIMGNDRESFGNHLWNIRPEDYREGCFVQPCMVSPSFVNAWHSRQADLRKMGWRGRDRGGGRMIPLLFTSVEQIEHYAKTLQFIQNDRAPESV